MKLKYQIIFIRKHLYSYLIMYWKVNCKNQVSIQYEGQIHYEFIQVLYYDLWNIHMDYTILFNNFRHKHDLLLYLLFGIR